MQKIIAAQIIKNLLGVLHPGAIGLIANHHGDDRCEEAINAVNAAHAWLAENAEPTATKKWTCVQEAGEFSAYSDYEADVLVAPGIVVECRLSIPDRESYPNETPYLTFMVGTEDERGDDAKGYHITFEQAAALLAANENNVKLDVFEGYLDFDGVRIVIQFQAPAGATVAEKDAAFMAALAQQANVDYLSIGSKTCASNADDQVVDATLVCVCCGGQFDNDDSVQTDVGLVCEACADGPDLANAIADWKYQVSESQTKLGFAVWMEHEREASAVTHSPPTAMQYGRSLRERVPG